MTDAEAADEGRWRCFSKEGPRRVGGSWSSSAVVLGANEPHVPAEKVAAKKSCIVQERVLHGHQILVSHQAFQVNVLPCSCIITKDQRTHKKQEPSKLGCQPVVER
jgi:hypothetical protein